MNGLYYQYGAGPAQPPPNYEAFLQLLDEFRKRNEGDAGSKSGGGQSSMDGFASMAKKLFPSGGGSGLSMDAMAGAAQPGYFDTPTGGLGGIAGLIA